MGDPGAQTSLEWYARFIAIWVAQEEQDPKATYDEVLIATREQCRQAQERHPEADFSLDFDLQFHLGARRLAKALFGNSRIVEPDKPAQLPVAHPFNEGRIQLFLKDGADTCRLWFANIKDMIGDTLEVSVGTGTRSVLLFRNDSLLLRRTSLLKKVKEVIYDHPKAFERKESKLVSWSVPDHELVDPRSTYDKIEASDLVHRLIEVVGVAIVVDNTYDRDQHSSIVEDVSIVRKDARLATEAQNRLNILKTMSYDAVRQAKHRARSRILKALVDLGLGGD